MADAYTRLADLQIDAAIFAQYQFEESVVKTDIFNAGILYSDPEITGKLGDGGFSVDMPMWDDLANIPSEPVNDDPTDIIEVKKVTSRIERATRNVRAQAWGNMDLNAILASDDPLRVIVERQASYWQRANKLTLLAMLRGIVADNTTNDGSDLVYTATSLADTDIIDAAYLMGDRADDFVAIWMHSKQMQGLRKLDQIDYVPSSQQAGVMLPVYQGLRVITDDDLPVAGNVYTAYMFKNRAIHWAEMPVNTDGGPFETDRKPRAGHGGGMTEVVGRRHFVPHVRGFSFTGTPAGKFATDTELAAATSWNRVTQYKKNVPFIAMRTTIS